MEVKLKAPAQPKVLQLVDKFLESKERKIQKGAIPPFGGKERAAIWSVCEWIVDNYRLTKVSPRTGEKE